MAKPRHYSPQLGRFLVCVLYHEARRRKVPMTRLANRLLESVLAGSEGWEAAVLAEAPAPCRTEPLQSIVDGQQTDKATAT